MSQSITFLKFILNVLLLFAKVNTKIKSIYPVLTFVTVVNCHILRRWPKSHWQNNFPSHYQATMMKMRNLYTYKKKKQNWGHINPYEYWKIHKNKIGRILKSTSMVFFYCAVNNLSLSCDTSLVSVDRKRLLEIELNQVDNQSINQSSLCNETLIKSLDTRLCELPWLAVLHVYCYT